MIRKVLIIGNPSIGRTIANIINSNDNDILVDVNNIDIIEKDILVGMNPPTEDLSKSNLKISNLLNKLYFDNKISSRNKRRSEKRKLKNIR